MTVLPLAEVADRVRDTTPRAGRTRVLAVDGRAGAGKTVLAGRLAALLPAPVLHMDDLYPGWDGLARAAPALVEQVLEPLSEGRPAAYRRWDWHRSAYAETLPVPAGPFLVVEGVACGSRAAARYLSLLVWVDAPAEARRRRAIERDGETFRPHWQRWAAQEDAWFARDRTRERADLVVDGDPGTPLNPAREVVVLR